LGNIKIDLFIISVPENEIGSIENVMLDALNTDAIEEELIDDCRTFIAEVAEKQDRYINKKSRICKAIFNTYFAIRAR